MKRVVFFLALIGLSTIAPAQKNEYVVYDWFGQVHIKAYRGQEWFPVQKNQPASIQDSVNIGEDGTLRILDRKTNLIYRSTTTGQMRLYAIVSEARKQDSHILAAVCRDVLNGAHRSADAPSMQVVGVTTRQTSDDSSMEDSIVSTFGWLACRVYNGELINNAAELILKSHAVADGIWFEMQNQSEKGYFVNVLHLNKKTKKVSLCYIIEQAQEPDAPYIYLPAGTTMRLEKLIFKTDSEEDKYILVGTEDAYIPEQIRDNLNRMDIDAAQPLYHKYTWYKP